MPESRGRGVRRLGQKRDGDGREAEGSLGRRRESRRQLAGHESGMRPEYSHRPIDFRYLSSAMRWLLGANIAGFLLIHFVPQFYDLFSLVPAHFWKDRYIWQVVTYMFL